MTDVRWLNDEEQETWKAFMMGATMVMATLDRQLQRDHGIPHAWYGMLVALSGTEDGRVRQGELAGFADFSLSRLSYAIGKLEQRGWVRRDVDPCDGRAWIVALTDEGRAALEVMAPDHVSAVRSVFFDPLTPTQASTLRRAFTRVLASAPCR